MIYGYNAAESYALAIAHLADRLRGGAPFATPWPTDDPGLSRAQRRELQTLLAARGHDIGEIDGALGDRSRAAIKLEQARLGQPATGRGGREIAAGATPGDLMPVTRHGFFSPAGTANGSQFSGGGSGQVAKGVKAQGGL